MFTHSLLALRYIAMLGAVEANGEACIRHAGMPGDEGTEWVRVQLGHLYEKTGDLKSAESTIPLRLRKDKIMLTPLRLR